MKQSEKKYSTILFLILIIIMMSSGNALAGSQLLQSHGNGAGTLSWNSASSALYDEDDLKIDIDKNFVTYRVKNSNGNWRQIKYTVNNPSNKEIRNDNKKMIWDNVVNGESITYEVVPHGIKLFINGNKRPLSNQWSFGYNTQGNIRWEEIENVGFVAFDEITGEYLWTILYPTMRDGDNRDIPLTFTRTGSAITITAPDLYTKGYNFTSWELDPSTQSGNTILIGDCQDLVCVSNSINNNTALKTVAAGEWVLNANLHNDNSANTFYINSSNVTWLKINSTSNVVNWIQTNGVMLINNTKITSWDETTSDTVNSGNRGYIYAVGISSRMDISNSNVSYLGYSVSNGYGVYYYSTSSGNSIINNTFLNNYYGIFLLGSSNSVTNNTITTSASKGIYLQGSSSNNIANNSITMSGRGIELFSNSNNNNITSNTITTSGSNGHGIFLSSSSSSNTITNNTITTSGSGGYGMYLIASSASNTISGGSIIAQEASTASYSFQTSPGTNYFVNTNFTTRKVHFNDATSWFNYSNNSGLTSVSTNISASKTMTRTLSSWTQTNITFTDSVTSGSATAYYNITGLLPNTNYAVLNNQNPDYNLTTDNNGMLSSDFSIAHTTTAKTITITNAPGAPTNLASTTCNFCVNTTWSAGTGVITDSYNVSVNGAWTNGSANPYHNSSLSAHAWHNVTIWAWNNSNSVLSETGTSLNTQIPNNLPTVPALIQHPDYHSITGTINISWTPSTDVDTDNLTYDIQVYNRTTGSLIVNQTGVSSNYSQNFSLLNWTTYNYTVRAYDSYNYSAWATVLEFSFTNSLPSIQNVTISPVNAGVTDNLTASMNVTDSDGDSLTNHFLWYKNSVLQTSWNDTLIINYSGNYTSGDTIYVKGYVNDSYNDSIQVQSNTVIIGSGNSAPILPGISLNQSTKKFNKTIWVNTTANITDAESTMVRLQVYYYSGSDKIYFTNSSWFAPPNNASVQITIPWADGLNHTIYAQAGDNGNITQDNTTNLTSTEATATFISDITVPTIVTSSLSATSITVGNSVLITAQFDGQDANVSSVLVRVERPDATITNWTMTCGSGENVTCTYTYTSTSDIGQYFVRFFYASDDSSNTGTIVSALTFTASAASSGGSGSGGGGGGIVETQTTTVIVKEPYANISALLSPINFINQTDTRSIADLEKIGQCLSKDLVLSSLCAGGTINIVTNPMNYWVLIGAFIGSFVLMYILAIYNEKKIAWFTDPLILGVAAIIITMTFTLVGFNMFFFNYIFEDSKPLLMTASFMMWGGFVSTAGFQLMYGGQKKNKTFEFIIGTPVKQTNEWAKHEWNKLLK